MKYQIHDVDEVIERGMPGKQSQDFMNLTQRQGQFEHLFKYLERPRFTNAIVAIAQSQHIPSFRLDSAYSTCSLVREVLVLISNQTLRMPVQTNSVAGADKGHANFLAREGKNNACLRSLPITCSKEASISHLICSINMGAHSAHSSRRGSGSAVTVTAGNLYRNYLPAAVCEYH